VFIGSLPWFLPSGSGLLLTSIGRSSTTAIWSILCAPLRLSGARPLSPARSPTDHRPPTT